MKRSIARQSIISAAGAAAVAALVWLVTLATQAAEPARTQALDDKEACIRNLKVIYQAIKAYEADHKDLPNWC